MRFSYSNPPLQQMPSRDEELGPLIRSVFLPEEGEIWCKADCLPAGISLRRALRRAAQSAQGARRRPSATAPTPTPTFTSWSPTDRTRSEIGQERQLRQDSTALGLRKFAAMIGKPEDEARAIYDQYDRELPFVSAASPCAQQKRRAKQGYIVLYDGARRHWDAWEAPGVAWHKGAGPCSREEAERRVATPSIPGTASGCSAPRPTRR